MTSNTLNAVRKLLCLCAVLAAGLALASLTSAADALPRLMPEALETDLALSALPERLRADAGVYVLRRGGFVEVKKAANHFSCFVVRSVPRFDVPSPDTLIPICFDDEGMRTVAPRHFDTAAWIEAGVSPAEIRDRIAANFADGTYQAPAQPGTSYMISPILNLPDGEGGVWNYPPHFMFYAPGLTNGEQDTMPDRGDGWLPWINNEGPHGMYIVPLGQTEREMVKREQADLIRRVEDFLNAG